MRNPAPSFRFGSLLFVPLEKTLEHLDTIRQWRNQERVRAQLFGSQELSEAEHLAWFERYLQESAEYSFVAFDGARPVGHAALYNQNPALGSAEFGRLYVGDERDLGKGFGAVITLAVTDFALRALKLQWLTLRVREDNRRAIEVYSAAGFKHAVRSEGKLTMALNGPPLRDWEHWDEDGVSLAIETYWQSEPAERAHREWLARTIARFGAGTWHRESTVLEVGCGSGELWSALASAGVIRGSYTGLDTSRQMLALAIEKHARNKKPGVSFAWGDLFSLSRSAGLVVCAEVLGHLPSFQEPLTQLWKATGHTLAVSLWLSDQEKRGHEQWVQRFEHNQWATADVVAHMNALQPKPSRLELVTGTHSTLILAEK